MRSRVHEHEPHTFGDVITYARAREGGEDTIDAAHVATSAVTLALCVSGQDSVLLD